MKKKLFKMTMLFAVWAIVGLNVQAQVSIGSISAPQKGELLELKNKEVTNPVSVTDPSNETVDENGGGLGFPRVRLVNLTTLEPFIPNDINWTNNVNKMKETHAGFVVYNINVTPGTETDVNKIFSQGLYVWTGSIWSKVEDTHNNKKFFYMPPFTIELDAPGTTLRYFNLYEEYKNQFTRLGNTTFVSSDLLEPNIRAHENDRLYLSNELNFIVTYYDSNVITVNSIDSSGLMEYVVNSLNLTDKSYINVVLEIK